uniref:Uncharacterized protein n=1 Tax=Kalanchoe fedtschenkoi TaxID=63787 RepID=A0A7N0VEG7_KALFE
MLRDKVILKASTMLKGRLTEVISTSASKFQTPQSDMLLEKRLEFQNELNKKYRKTLKKA